jgi:regulator of sigma E protease
MPEFLRSVLSFVVVLGVLVFVHELGHYLAARWRGIHVEAFSIGFGQALFSWTDKVGTVWKIAWIPLGGYVKMHGQERPEDVSAEDRAKWIPGRTFHEKSVGSRAIVVAAGPIANFVLAVVLFAVLFATAGRPVIQPVVGEVMADSAAAHAGLLADDRIVSIDGAPIATFEDIQKIITGRPGQTMPIVVDRDGNTKTLSVTTEARTEKDGARIGMLGIKGGRVTYERMSLAASVVGGVTQTWEVTRQTFDGLAQMLSGRRGTEDLGGPLRIAQLSGQVAQLGLASLVSFIAVLSINLGLINLFPIPILDGGHLVFYAAEAIRGRIELFVFATWNDLTHLGIFRWVAGLIGS